MKVNTFEECTEEYGSFDGLDSVDKAQRQEKLKMFPYSVVVQGSYLENDVATKWCWEHFGEIYTEKCDEYGNENTGCPIAQKAHEMRKVSNIYSMDSVRVDGVLVLEHSHSGIWTTFWYGKIAYDYGFWEFFFKNAEDATHFKDAIPNFYIETEYGKWKTDGWDKHIDID